MVAILQVLSGKNAGTKYDVGPSKIRLGRDPTCEVHIDLNAVSRTHAVIFPDDGRLWIQDLKSRNGTYVNGKRVEERVVLADNDRVKICDVLFVFRDTQPVAPPPPGVRAEEDERESAVLTAFDVRRSEMMVKVKPEVKLRAILDITQTIGKTLDLEKLFPKILDSLFSIFPHADRALILLADNSGRLIPKAVKHRRQGDDAVRYSRTIVRTAMSEKKAVLSADAASDARFSMSESIADFSIRSIMCVPLLAQEDRALGVIQLDTQSQNERFDEEDLEILASVAVQASTSIENAQMHEAIVAQQRFQQELVYAQSIQRGLLPKKGPDVPGYQFWAYYESAGQVGGDYYDYIKMLNGKFAIILGDVSGKGVPAALVMAMASSEVKVGLLTYPADPAQAMNQINTNIEANTPEDRFITMVICVLDPAAHRLTIVNAGHMSPIIRRRDGSLEEPAGEDVSGLPVGVMSEYPYDSVHVDLGSGEQVVMYSDGISEAMDDSLKEYTIDRLREKVRAANLPAEELGPHLLRDVKAHVGGFKQSDDISMVVFGRLPNA